ncbi:tetratricopeptide repeat protein [Tunicatimonas pelagia]|uniref:tetratricopeptide repeat protein n=1 Tax=Tunicatimonas pelagia TaxID=931531 RepID=UPI002665F04D|nr:tetratricopeptide repeat protein [Tunicatimonas pelagia]WKN43887.1 tetratricopeptide repeat protein [Tunicatimonas pelagia]
MHYFLSLLITLLTSLAVYAQQNEEEEVIINNEANGINNQGYEAMEQGDYERAKELFRQAIAIDSSAVIYYENLALACQQSEDQAGVIQCYQLAKQNLPNNPTMFYYSGDALQNAERYEEAIRDYDQAIALSNLEPTDLLHFFYFNRGNAYLKLKDFQTAVDNYGQALEVFPQHAASYANRGMARYNLKDKKGACTDWQQAYDNGYEPAASYQQKYCE